MLLPRLGHERVFSSQLSLLGLLPVTRRVVTVPIGILSVFVGSPGTVGVWPRRRLFSAHEFLPLFFVLCLSLHGLAFLSPFGFERVSACNGAPCAKTVSLNPAKWKNKPYTVLLLGVTSFL